MKLLNEIIKNGFSNIIVNGNNIEFTENGALTHKTSMSSCVDLFALGGAARNMSVENLTKLFRNAMNEDSTTALKILFYIRDVRGGQGERKTFRILLEYCADHYLSEILGNIKNIPEYGRWDDAISLLNYNGKNSHTIHTEVFNIIKSQLVLDINNAKTGKTVSNLAKWMPSINTSSDNSKKLANKIRQELNLTPREYRKTLVNLRKIIGIVETKLCERNYSKIEYDKIPSKAGLLYKDAFKKHDTVRYTDFISKVLTGEKKINSSTLYPHEITTKLGGKEDPTLDAMWQNLPDYLSENPHNGIVVADVSSSMSGVPLQVSISLAIYMAERSKGKFKDHFITFSGKPCLQKITGNTLREKYNGILRSDWETNTNIEAVFDLILKTALSTKCIQSDLPDVIYIISDMQFDYAVHGNNNKTMYKKFKDMFESYGYNLPKIVFWNVDASNNIQSPVTMNENGVALVSGYSPVTFKTVLSGDISPVKIMLKTVYADRYSAITVP